MNGRENFTLVCTTTTQKNLGFLNSKDFSKEMSRFSMVCSIRTGLCSKIKKNQVGLISIFSSKSWTNVSSCPRISLKTCVASLLWYFSRILIPPGCWEAYDVTSKE